MSTDECIVAALDAEYQEAVKNNDVATMDRILADDFALVTGNGAVYTKADLLKEAAARTVIYERQEDSNRTVRIWNDMAVVTALLWATGTERGEPFDYKAWFSDTYVRTASGWRYVFGQSSLRFQRMGDTSNASVEVAITKAQHAADYRRDTKFHEDLLGKGNAIVLSLPRGMPLEGGLRLLADGKVIGGIGVSGVTSAQDGQIAKRTQIC